MEKIGNSLSCFEKLNQQLYFSWLHIIKNERETPSTKNVELDSEAIKWKKYAQTLETNLKEIRNFQKTTSLKKDLIKNLDLYSFSSIILIVCRC